MAGGNFKKSLDGLYSHTIIRFIGTEGGQPIARWGDYGSASFSELTITGGDKETWSDNIAFYTYIKINE